MKASKFCFSALIIIGLMTSCNKSLSPNLVVNQPQKKSTQIDKSLSDSTFVINKKLITDRELITKFDSVISSLRIVNPSDSSILKFNTDSIYELTTNLDSTIVLFVNQKDFSRKQQINFGFGIALDSDTILSKSYICETDSVNKSIKDISYYNSSMEKLLTEELNSQSETIKTTYIYGQDGSTVKFFGCGDAVSGCIQDAYSHHGWISVGLFIETAFIPETAVVIAGDCAFHNC